MSAGTINWTAYYNSDFRKTWTFSYDLTDYSFECSLWSDDLATTQDFTITQGTYTLLFKLSETEIETITEGVYNVSVKQISDAIPNGKVIGIGKIVVTYQGTGA